MPTFGGVVAVLDACVLYPQPLCDTLLGAAAAGLYQPRWSDEILREVVRTFVKQGRPRAKALDRVAAMRGAFDDAMVRRYRSLIGGLTNDPKDRHVLAAAIRARARRIVTSNLRHFPRSALDPFGIEAWSPDDFLTDLFYAQPGQMVAVVRAQAGALTQPPMTVGQVLDRLAPQAKTFASLVRGALP